ncbi:hypothetical protein MKK88_30080 [Methylobacterium sp. E-005]|uniref:DUF6894 family protein n=1 Tax=Methylobacterium sp. E-005 TaxID=2836549 RepID=UPI001FB8B758|nr:hypothetical protein [Methylobacterium sp. E-005]MCJ2090202.1 hypothetical protein [Methylobacterium sp. E-005]
MPRFHFHVHDGCSVLDTEGTELPDTQAARLEAIRIAGDILKHDAHRIALGEDWRIEVTDDTGLILFQMTFLVVESPVMRRAAGADR